MLFPAKWAERSIFFIMIKARNFTFLIYPESAPEDWKEKLTDLGRPVAISPLHDQDLYQPRSKDAIRKDAERKAKKECEEITDEEERKKVYAEKKAFYIEQITADQIPLINTNKKPHHHVIYVNPNPVTTKSVLLKLQRVLGENVLAKVQIVDNIEGEYLYLTHESATAIRDKKHVYDKKDIICLNGFDIARYVTLDVAEKKNVLEEVIKIIRANMIANIIDLDDYLDKHAKEHGLDLQAVATVKQENHGFLRLYFDGAYQKKRAQLEQEKAELLKKELDFKTLVNQNADKIMSTEEGTKLLSEILNRKGGR